MTSRVISTHTRIARTRMPASRTHLAVSFIRANSRKSAEAQRELCRQHAYDRKLHITYEFAVIGVGSSHTATFEALIGLFYYLNKNPQVSHLITADYSRLARHGEVFAEITEMLNKLEVELTTHADIIHLTDGPI
ncbi:recombinase family protein [Lentzea sp. NPDC051208]|uniref:recombinase family protein n=1 Tax=Lentzea sp. NPDC051208 TaxID=3154642 RepID=UPI003432045F